MQISARDDITMEESYTQSFEEVDRHKRVPPYASIDRKFENSMVLERQDDSCTWGKRVSGSL